MAPPVAIQQLQLIIVYLNHYPNDIINKCVLIEYRFKIYNYLLNLSLVAYAFVREKKSISNC